MHYYEHDIIYTYGFGYRLDAQPKCKPGNKPCGKTCIPMKEKCRLNSPQNAISKLKATTNRNKNIALGVAGLGAAGLGILALQNRQKLKRLREEEKQQKERQENNKPKEVNPPPPKDVMNEEEMAEADRRIAAMADDMDDDDDEPKNKKKNDSFYSRYDNQHLKYKPSRKQHDYFMNMPRIDSKMCKKGRKCGNVCMYS